MTDTLEDHRHYAQVSEALTQIAETWGERHPSLKELADICEMSEFHFQRVFERWVGLSPKKFLGIVSLDRAKQALLSQSDVLGASLEAGLSGPGRLHDLFVKTEAMTPGDYKQAARNLTIRWAWHEGPFGQTLVMCTERGLCGMAFLDSRGIQACYEDMASRWPKAALTEDAEATEPYMSAIFGNSGVGNSGSNRQGLRLFLKGTAFQIKVWEALMRISAGDYTTYGALSERIGMSPHAARAVGTAVGANPISWLIPCHRVIRNSGMLGGYRWGLPRKIAMMGFERSGQGLRLHVA